jgi:hypothetical protein
MTLGTFTVRLKQLQASAVHAVELAPANQVYRTEVRPFIAIDECIDSREIRSALCTLLSSGLASSGSALKYEAYLTRDRKKLAPSHFDSSNPENPNDAHRRARLPRMPWPDGRVASQIISNLYIHRNVVVLSGDRGMESNGLRECLSRGAGPALNSGQLDLSLTLLLQNEYTTTDDYIQELFRLISSQQIMPGYREILV